MFIDVHVIQNFPYSCLNRGETGLPKNCEFGEQTRARVSSQSFKRAVRVLMDEMLSKQFPKLAKSLRSKHLLSMVVDRLQKKGHSADESTALVKAAIEGTGFSMEDIETKVLLFLGNDEVDRLANELHACWGDLQTLKGYTKPTDDNDNDNDNDKKNKIKTKVEKRIEKAAKAAGLPDSVKKAMETLTQGSRAIALALSGRMVVERDSMGIEASCQVAHAFSTNRALNQIDFWVGIDDLKPKGQQGAGMTGSSENNSPCLYRYANISYKKLLSNLQGDENLAQIAVCLFLEAFTKAIPTGKQNSSAAVCPPLYVRVIVRGNAPMNLANAFINPILPSFGEDLGLESIKRLDDFERRTRQMYGDKDILEDVSSSVYGENRISILDLIDRIKNKLP